MKERASMMRKGVDLRRSRNRIGVDVTFGAVRQPGIVKQINTSMGRQCEVHTTVKDEMLNCRKII